MFCNGTTDCFGGGGMEPGSLSVTRTLPIDGALLGDALLRLRRDAASACLRWNLGERGSVELDANVVSDDAAWGAAGRPGDPGRARARGPPAAVGREGGRGDRHIPTRPDIAVGVGPAARRPRRPGT